MNDRKSGVLTPASPAETTIRLLSAVEEGTNASQRSLAVRIGVALGLTNALLKRCIKKGMLKASEAPARRYAYYLTPKGLREKSKLTVEYLSHSLGFFRRARGDYVALFETCARKGWTRVALHGTGELAEIAFLAANEVGVELTFAIDGARNVPAFMEMPVRSSVDKDDAVDAIVIAVSEDAQDAYEALLSEMPEGKVLAPQFLYLSQPTQEQEVGRASGS